MAADRLEILTEEIADGLIVRLEGEIDMTRAPALRDELAAVQARKPARLILDLAGVGSVDSSVLATFVEALQVARCDACLLILCGMRARVRAVFELARLDVGTFEIVPTTDEAIALANRRKFPRFRDRDLRCDLGEIVDLSSGGIKLRVRKRLRGRLRMRLSGGGEQVALEAAVSWSRRIRFRRHEAGLRFVGLRTAEAKKLATILAAARETSARLK